MRWTLLNELPRICEVLGPSFNEAAVDIAHESLFELDEFLLTAAIECVETLLENEVFKGLRASSDLRPFEFVLFHPAADIRRSMLCMLLKAKDFSRTRYANIWGQHVIDHLADIASAVAENLEQNVEESSVQLGTPVTRSLYEAVRLELVESSDYSSTDHDSDRQLPLFNSYAEEISKCSTDKGNYDSSRYSLQASKLHAYMMKVAVKLSRMSVNRAATEDYVGGGYFREAHDI